MMNRFSPFGNDVDGPITGRINFFGPGSLPLEPVSFHGGWQGEPEPAAATPMGHGGTVIRKVFGLDRSIESQVAGQIVETPDSPERNALYAEWDDLNQRVREFLIAAHEKRIANLRTALADVLSQGRTALDEWKACVAEVADARRQVNDYLDPLSKAHIRLKQAKASKPDPDEWPTPDELVEHETRVAQAQDRVDRAEQHHTELKEKLTLAQARAATARTRLQALREQRDQLKAQIEGRATKGPYGLMVPGSGA